MAKKKKKRDKKLSAKKTFFTSLATIYISLIAQLLSARSRFEKPGIRFPDRSNRQCRQRLAIAETFLRSCVAQALSRGDGPRHSLHATLRRNTASIMKI